MLNGCTCNVEVVSKVSFYCSFKKVVGGSPLYIRVGIG
jgi:hypothetical protein